MKLIFAHDHRFYKYKDDFYSNGSFSKEVLKRYTNIFEEVVVLSRQVEISELSESLTLSTTDRVRFVKIPDFKAVKTFYKRGLAKKIINKEVKNGDAVIGRNSSIGNLAAVAAKSNNIPYLVEMVGCPWDALWNHSLKGKVLAPLQYFSTKKIVKDAPNVIYVTNNFLQDRYPNNGYNTNCSDVALTEFDDDVIKRRIKTIESMNMEEKIIIGTTAAIDVKYKGQQHIIKALGKLKEEGITNYEYQLAGGGDNSYLLKVAQKSNVENQIKFLGSIPHEKVFKWLEKIDIYAQPSKQEGLPRAMVEAMSRGLPAFGAKTGGIPELIESKYIFKHGMTTTNRVIQMILSFDKKTMLEQAKKNYEESKKYSENIISERRNNFLKDFKESVLKN